MYPYNALLFHNITEIFGVIVACGIFMLAWNSRKFQDNHFFLFIGITYLFVGILELVHVLSWPGMNIFQSHGLNVPVQIRIGARYVESISLLIAPLFIRRKLKHEYLFLGYTSTVFFLLWSIFYKNIFPVCIINGIGLSPFSIVSEFIICLIFVAACGLLIQKRKEFDSSVLRLLVASVILTIGSEFAYAFHKYVNEQPCLTGHILKVASFFLIYKAVIETGLMKPYQVLFRSLKQSADELTTANEQLNHEITERKRAEDSIRVAYTELSQIFNSSADGMCVIDKEYRMLRMNDTLRTMLDISDEETIGKKCYQILGDSICETSMCPITRLWNGEPRFEQDVTLKWRDAKRISCILSVTPLRNPDGELLGVIENFKDITKRKEIEEKLRKSNEDLAEAQEVGRIGSWELDLLTNTINLSDQTYRMLGFKPGEISPTYETLIAFIHSEDRHFVEKKVKEAIRENKHLDLDFRVISKDGTEHIEHIQAQVFYDKSGKPIRMVGINQDITEHKRLEQELQRVQQFESIGILAGGIAHDFNNLLTGIMGNISLVELYIPPDGKAPEILTETKKNCYQAAGLTQQLLTFSKGGTPSKKLASMKELIENTASFSLRGSKIKCECFISNTLWPVEIDEVQIGQVISNVIINAQQAMPKGGTIEIRAENRAVSSEDGLPLTKGKYIQISIKDQGIGIPKEYLRSIFDPYFTTKKEGSGLGLAICFSIIKRHGGHIMVKSKVSVGTTFDIFLPASLKEIFKVEAIEKEKIYPGKGRILLMDDQKQIRDMVGHMLNYLGYEVESACDGDEAIQLYKKAKEAGNPFHAVILDLTIPGGIGGKEVIQKLLEIDPDVKAIVSSGFSNDSTISEYGKYGFREAVAKPYEIKELSKVLHTVMLSGLTK